MEVIYRWQGIPKMAISDYFVLYFSCMKSILSLTPLALSFLVISCSSGTKEIPTLPPPPASVKAVADYIKSNYYDVLKAGFYSNLSINDKREIEWVDTAKEENSVIKKSVRDELLLRLQFGEDSTMSVHKKDTSYAATYKIDDVRDEKEEGQPGIKLRISYRDPSFSFGNETPLVTYTWVILGMNEKYLLLQTPQTINQKKLISLLKMRGVD